MSVLTSIFHEIRVPCFLLMVTIIFGSLGYKLIYPDISWIKIIFMVAITLTTVGYADILSVENNPSATIYTIVLMVLGMGSVLYAVSSLTAFIVDGKLKEIFATEELKKRIKNMKNHFIICGAGQTGIHVIREIHTAQKKIIVIDQDETLLKKIYREFPSCAIINGDSTDDFVLHQANIKEAKGLIATLSNDKDNLFLTISAHLMNPHLVMVSKAIDTKHMPEKLKQAGATYIVSPNLIGGMRIASEILRPHVVSFLDHMLRGEDKSIRIEEVIVSQNSPLINKTLKTSNIYEKTGLVIIAVGSNNAFTYNPSLNTRIKAGMVILVICNPKQHQKLSLIIS